MSCDNNVSIIICTKDRAESLRETLASIGRCEVPADLPTELLVVDNGSIDSTRQVVEQTELKNIPMRYVPEPRKGKGYAYNTGMAEACGDIFLFTDDDVRVPKNWIEGMCRPIVEHAADAVAGAIRIADQLRRPWMKPIHFAWLACTTEPDSDQKSGSLFLIGANMAIRRTVLRRVPAFDPELGPGAKGHADDTLLSVQIREAGYRILAMPQVDVEHHFDPARLNREAYVRQANKRGEFNAYVAHHWFHADWRLPHLKLIREWLRLNGLRMCHLRDWWTHPSAPAWELVPMEGYFTFKHYLREHKRPRNYEKHGLVKLNHA
jgi:glycosyltransferase involved in cell wall biosynthesis